MQSWHTLLALNEHHPKLGLEGTIYFIVDLPFNIETDKLDFMIAQPTSTGLGVTGGISSYILTKEKIETLFTVHDKNFHEYEIILTARFHNQSQD